MIELKESEHVKIRWSFVDKYLIAKGLKDYENDMVYSEFLDNTDIHKEDIYEYRENGVYSDLAKGGYGRMPMIYVIDDFSKHQEKYGYSNEDHRFMVYVGCHICTFLSHGKGVKSSNITKHTKKSLPDIIELVDKIGHLYGIYIIKDYNEAQRRTLYYLNVNKQMVHKRDVEIIANKNKDKNNNVMQNNGYDDVPRDENGDFIETENLQEYVDLFA